MTEQTMEGAGGLCRLCECGALWDTVDAYLCECREQGAMQEGTNKRSRPPIRFPNLAGLCRFAQTGMSSLRGLSESYPEEYDRLLAVFEDEALNADLSPTLLSAYMKKRLLYIDEGKGERREKEVSYCFEHDIYADGE